MIKIEPNKLYELENDLSSFLHYHSYFVRSKKIKLSTKIAYSMLISKYRIACVFSTLVLFSVSFAFLFYIGQNLSSHFLSTLDFIESLFDKEVSWADFDKIQDVFSSFWSKIVLLILASVSSLTCIAIMTKMIKIIRAFSKRNLILFDDKK